MSVEAVHDSVTRLAFAVAVTLPGALGTAGSIQNLPLAMTATCDASAPVPPETS